MPEQAWDDNWRQSTYDKLQLIQTLVDAPDIDGDGTLEFDTDRMAYWGVSLGGTGGGGLAAF